MEEVRERGGCKALPREQGGSWAEEALLSLEVAGVGSISSEQPEQEAKPQTGTG